MDSNVLVSKETLLSRPAKNGLLPEPVDVFKVASVDRNHRALINEATDRTDDGKGSLIVQRSIFVISYRTADDQQRYLLYRSAGTEVLSGFLGAIASTPTNDHPANLFLSSTKPDVGVKSELSSLDDTWLDTKIISMVTREDKRNKIDDALKFWLWDLKPACVQPEPGQLCNTKFAEFRLTRVRIIQVQSVGLELDYEAVCG